MYKKMSEKLARRGVQLWILIAVLLFAFPVYASVDVAASIQASGEGAIFDIKANGNGTLQVATKAGRVGDRWRVTIVQANTNGGISSVGNGSSSTYTGWAASNVKVGINYIVLVTFDRPLPGTFPAKVNVRFAGTSQTNNPPVIPLSGGQLINIKPRPITASVSPSPSPTPGCPNDGSLVGCGALVTCELKPAGDTDTFKIKVPTNAALSINVSGDTYNYWQIFDPQGKSVYLCPSRCNVALPISGTYTIEVYNSQNRENPYTLSVLGVSAAFNCGNVILPSGTPVNGKFETGGDTNSYQLNNVKANETYSINVTGDTYNYWQIFDPQGKSVYLCPSHCNVKLPVAGNYTIEVYNSQNRTGAYTLSVQKVSN